MQKVLRRTALAKAQAVRKSALRAEKRRKIGRALHEHNDELAGRQASLDIRNARVKRQEVRELGPLAPRWDVGENKDTYGTMDQRRIRGKNLPKEQKLPFHNIVEGDRVVVIDGRDKGRIGEVKSLDKKSNQVTVKGMNMVDVAVPKWLRDSDPNGEAPSVHSVELGIPLIHVRLVHALVDPETGAKRDVIVQKIAMGNVFHDHHNGVTKWSRFIPGLDIRIPWPKKTPTEQADQPPDTLRIDVEAKTWVPTLLRPPMPPSIIDELRNKYSVFRDRHDDEFIEAKMKEDEEKKARLRLETMTTPTMEAQRKEKKERRGMGKRARLTEEQLAKIGEVMARTKGLDLSSLPPVEDVAQTAEEQPVVG